MTVMENNVLYNLYPANFCFLEIFSFKLESKSDLFTSFLPYLFVFGATDDPKLVYSQMRPKPQDK